MFLDLLDILVCPKCKTPLRLKDPENTVCEIMTNYLICENNHVFQIREGVVDFKVKEQIEGNNWSELYQQYNYEMLDELLLNKVSECHKEAGRKTIDEIIDRINAYQSNSILDIATGRGILLRSLIQNYGLTKKITCIDLSFEVLKYDRLKTMKLNPDMKINYIACDASQMPFVENAFDIAVSLAGITNMNDSATQGVVESLRVSKSGLISTAIVVKEKDVKQHKAITESKFKKIHEVMKYPSEIYNVFEHGYQEEWFGVAICTIKSI